MRKKSPYKKKSLGFSLIELMVAVGLFSIVMTVGMGTLVVIIRAGGAAQEKQTLTANLSFVLDGMSRKLRTGYNYYCADNVVSGGMLVSGSSRSDCASGASAIAFIDGETGDRMAYRYDSSLKAILQRIDDGGAGGAAKAITASGVEIEDLEFIVEWTGIPPADTNQPQVRILLHGQAAGIFSKETPFFIQTAVTSRGLDV